MNRYAQTDGMWPLSFRNDSGESAPAFSIMAVKEREFRNDELVLICDKPSGTLYRDWVISGPLAVADDGYGHCSDLRHSIVKYDTGTPAIGEGWGVKSGQWTISKGYPGCTIVGIHDATQKMALVSLDVPFTEFPGKLDGTLSQGGSQTVSLWTSGASTPATGVDTTWNVTAYDWLMKPGATAIASGKKVVIKHFANNWYVTEAECA